MEQPTTPTPKPTGVLAYQQRLLDRASSRSGTLGRSGSIASIGAGSGGAANATRRWAPGHRAGVGGSVDASRARWDERAREADADAPLQRQPSFPPTSSPAKDDGERPAWTPGHRTAAGGSVDAARSRWDDAGASLQRQPSFPPSPAKEDSDAAGSGVTSRWAPGHRAGVSVDAARGRWDDAGASLQRQPTVTSSPAKDESERPAWATTPSRPIRANTIDNASPTSSTLNRADSASSTRGLGALKRNGSVSSTISKFETEAVSNATPSASTSTPPPRPRPASLYGYGAVPAPSDVRAQFEAATPSSPSFSSPPASAEKEKPKRARPISLYSGSPVAAQEVRKEEREKERESKPIGLYGSSAYARPTDTRPQTVFPAPPATSPDEQLALQRAKLARHRSISPDKPLVPFAPALPALPLSPAPSPGSAMSPAPYTSGSAMSPAPYTRGSSSKPYGESLTAGRRLGKHLPRIASGDADEDWIAPDPEPAPPMPPPPTRSRLTRQLQGELASAPAPHRAGLVAPGKDQVVGISGRIRLSRASKPALSRELTNNIPVPSGKLRHGLWADTQRHLLQAYEYLCHVGEAQQWIEGCLGSELGFGVEGFDDGLKNGAVLAKLVRVFMGEGAVPKIWETPYPDWRHSDNINAFFVFIRDPSVGLPESFVFETTDLYNKKNLPKVIYCIHALSHLLARLGRAQRIGNLLGQLQFSDDLLEQTRRGLTAAGVAMPNFGNIGRSLAREMNQPEPEESEEERRDRILLEHESSIVDLQSTLRAFLVRKQRRTQHAELQLLSRYIVRVQAQARGVLARKHIAARLDDIDTHAGGAALWARLQAAARGALVRRRVDRTLDAVHRHKRAIVALQARARGALVRARIAKLKGALVRIAPSLPRLQAVARARLVVRAQRTQMAVYTAPGVSRAVVGTQAAARGVLARRAVAARLTAIDAHEDVWVALQAQLRGILVRRRVGRQLARLDDAADVVVRIQAFLRSYLARKRLLRLIRALRAATPLLVRVQARARAQLAERRRAQMHKALGTAQVATAVGGFQARARAALARTRHAETVKELEFAAPDVVGIQAAARGALLRREWRGWRDHVRAHAHVAVRLQALLRGLRQRRTFTEKMAHYRAHMGQVVKIQALFRAKETREQYRELTLGTHVSVGALKSFVHLLDDSEADFADELRLERARKAVVERIRECQALETDVSALDVKIALVVNNAKTFEELKDARRRYGADAAALHAARAGVLAAHGDPFAGPSTLDATSRRKLELYQQLFYLLQSRAEYLGRLFRVMSADGVPEKDRRALERVVLTLFGYGSDRREDFLLLKVLQYAVGEEVAHAATLADVVGRGQRVWINVTLAYLRHKQAAHLRETLAPLVADMLAAPDLDLEADPVAVFRARADMHEMRTGVAMDPARKNASFAQATADGANRAEYIRHLQVLQWWADAFVRTLTGSTKRMPFAVRFLARELRAAALARFPDAPPVATTAALGRLVYYRYVNPAVVTPETYGIVSTTLDISTRKNLAQVSRVLTQVASGAPFDDAARAYMPINDFLESTRAPFAAWLADVAAVPDAEEHYHAHDFLDATVQPRPIYITPNEVYAVHALLSAHLPALALGRDDALRTILTELGGVPQAGSADAQLADARERPIALELTNRFAHIRDPRADEQARWLQAKRAVLAILRVQPARDLVEALMQPVTEEHEAAWEDVLAGEMAEAPVRHARAPSAAAPESAYRLEDIRQLSFREVKAHAIFFLLELEKEGKITRADGYQGVLNAIAGDVRSKRRMRLQRQAQLAGMDEALTALDARKKHYLGQLESYGEYVEQSMATMQRGKSNKKRMTMPFTKQFFHQRDLAKAGRTPQFGSFKYSAQDLYERGLLLSVDGFSPLQFGKLDVILSADRPGVFNVEVLNGGVGGGMVALVGAEDVRMQDLLQMKFEDKAALALLGGRVKFNLELLLFQINKKFYV